MISITNEPLSGDEGYRITMTAPRGKIILTVTVDEEGYPVVDMCMEPTDGHHTNLFFVERDGTPGTNISDPQNRQLCLTFAEEG